MTTFKRPGREYGRRRCAKQDSLQSTRIVHAGGARWRNKTSSRYQAKATGNTVIG